MDLVHVARCVAVARNQGCPEEDDGNSGKGKGKVKTDKGVRKKGKGEKGKGKSKGQPFHQAAIARPYFNEEADVYAGSDPMNVNE